MGRDEEVQFQAPGLGSPRGSLAPQRPPRELEPVFAVCDEERGLCVCIEVWRL